MGVVEISVAATVPRKGAFRRAAAATPNIVKADFQQNLGPKVLRITRYAAPHKSRRLERGLRFQVAGAGDSAVLEVQSGARSQKGFPYTRATRFGRRAIVPRRAKALAFTVNGKKLVRRRVGPYKPAGDWVAKAHEASKAEMRRSAKRIGGKVHAVIVS